jgi:hypothetical protein
MLLRSPPEIEKGYFITSSCGTSEWGSVATPRSSQAELADGWKHWPIIFVIDYLQI